MDDNDNPKTKLVALLVALSLGAAAVYQTGFVQGQHAEAISRDQAVLRQSEETFAVLREQERVRTAQLALTGRDE